MKNIQPIFCNQFFNQLQFFNQFFNQFQKRKTKFLFTDFIFAPEGFKGPGFKESASIDPFPRHENHKIQTTEEGRFGFYSRLISTLVPAPNVHHSDSSPWCHCTKTLLTEGEPSPRSAAEASRFSQQLWKA